MRGPTLSSSAVFAGASPSTGLWRLGLNTAGSALPAPAESCARPPLAMLSLDERSDGLRHSQTMVAPVQNVWDGTDATMALTAVEQSDLAPAEVARALRPRGHRLSVTPSDCPDTFPVPGHSPGKHEELLVTGHTECLRVLREQDTHRRCRNPTVCAHVPDAANAEPP